MYMMIPAGVLYHQEKKFKFRSPDPLDHSYYGGWHITKRGETDHYIQVTDSYGRCSPGTDYYVSNSGVCAINETGALWPWAVTYSYGNSPDLTANNGAHRVEESGVVYDVSWGVPVVRGSYGKIKLLLPNSGKSIKI